MKIRVLLDGTADFTDLDSEDVKVETKDGCLVLTYKSPRRRVTYAPGRWQAIEEELGEPRPRRTGLAL